jgi:non-specific serine/threonine protein kinase
MLPLYLISLGYQFLLQGDHERAAALNEEAVAIYRGLGRRVDRVSGLGEPAQTALNNLGWVALVRGDHERAKALYIESLALSQELGDRLIAAKSIEGLACAAEAERAAKLFGAAQMLQEAVGYSPTPIENTLWEPYLAAARSRLDEATWKAAFAEGQVMTLEEAIEYALSSVKSSASPPPTPERPQEGERPAILTRREKEVAQRVARGLTNRQIASQLSISESTIENHVSKILNKLRLDSRSQLSAWVTERRLLSSDSR